MSELLQNIEIETAPNPTAAIIWLHGLGADGNDFVPIVRELDLAGLPGIRFVFPHAPIRPITINNGVRMRGWYDIVGTHGRVVGIDHYGASADAKTLFKEFGFTPEKVVEAAEASIAAVEGK